MKLSKKTITIGCMAFSLLVLTLVAALSHTPQVSTVQAQEPGGAQHYERSRFRPCSPRTMKGTHGYSYQGTVMGKAITAAGPITFDGQGSLHATYNVNLGGTPFTGRFIGIYTVNDDCTGTVTLHLPLLGLSTNGSFVIVNEGQETFFTGTDEGIAITGLTKKR
jgi:hypothetical protein